jgi:hypothetical protein
MEVTGVPCRIKAVLVLLVGLWIHELASDSPEECCLGSWLCFTWFYAQMHLHIFLDQHMWNPLDNGLILMFAFPFYAGFDGQIWYLMTVNIKLVLSISCL